MPATAPTAALAHLTENVAGRLGRPTLQRFRLIFFDGLRGGFHRADDRTGGHSVKHVTGFRRDAAGFPGNTSFPLCRRFRI